MELCKCVIRILHSRQLTVAKTEKTLNSWLSVGLVLAQKVVEGTGFEPVKPLGRQIYSLFRLTAPAPLQMPTTQLDRAREGTRTR